MKYFNLRRGVGFLVQGFDVEDGYAIYRAPIAWFMQMISCGAWRLIGFSASMLLYHLQSVSMVDGEIPANIRKDLEVYMNIYIYVKEIYTYVKIHIYICKRFISFIKFSYISSHTTCSLSPW